MYACNNNNLRSFFVLLLNIFMVVLEMNIYMAKKIFVLSLVLNDMMPS